MTIPEDHSFFLRTTFAPEVELAHFSEVESALLMRYGAWFNALMERAIQPYTDAQRHFVDMCRGKVAASTEHEIVWRKYRMELMYLQAVQMEKGAGIYSYRDIRALFEKLAKMGHKKSRSWLIKEGAWEDLPSERRSTYTNPVYDSIFPMIACYGGAARESGEQERHSVKEWKLRRFGWRKVQ